MTVDDRGSGVQEQEPQNTTEENADDVHGVLYEPPEQASEAEGKTDWIILGVAGALAIAFVVWGATSTKGLQNISLSVLGWIMNNLGWAFVLTATGFVVFSLWLAFSRYGRIPLGRDDEKPEFRTVSWIAMMFSAGMGIGLMFYGVTEPISHFTAQPGTGKDTAQTVADMQTAMATTLFHWTLHPWAIYAVVGLAIAYSTFRRGRKQLISSVFAPLFGERRTEGGFGKFIDILAIFATLFGSAASLGLGALQIGAGTTALKWLENPGSGLLVGIIVILTIAFVASAVSGIAKGIQWLSNINMVLAGLLAVFLFVVGPTILILELIPTSVGEYFRELAQMSARTGATSDHEWLAGWTVFYWAWWISWTPFVGMFLARISRGRSIKQFVVGVLVVPSVVSLLWFCVLGGTAIDQQMKGADIVGAGGQEAQLFTTLQQFPWATLTSILVMVLVAIFFVSGADAASIVMGTLSQQGTIEPKRYVVVFWGVLTGAVAAIMLLIGSGELTEDGKNPALEGLKNITIAVGAPFMIVMVALCVALAIDLRSDPLMKREERGSVVLEQAVVAGTEQHGSDFELAVTGNNVPEPPKKRSIASERPHTKPPTRKPKPPKSG